MYDHILGKLYLNYLYLLRKTNIVCTNHKIEHNQLRQIVLTTAQGYAVVENCIIMKLCMDVHYKIIVLSHACMYLRKYV